MFCLYMKRSDDGGGIFFSVLQPADEKIFLT